MSKTIPLSQGKFALVDDEDYEFLNQWKWCAHKNKNNVFYVERNELIPKRKIIKMHRVIMNAPIGMEVDHIDRDGLNNQKANLRLCTQTENQRNKSLYRNNSSGYRGVKANGRNWQSEIRVNGQGIYIGTYKTKVEAAQAYDLAAKKYHKDFANLNFPEAINV
jgi:hypothetical protein